MPILPDSPMEPLRYGLKKCRHGTFLYNHRDIYIGRSMALYGEYAEGTVRLLSQFIRPGDFIIEAGANIGALTVPLAKLVGPTGCVFAAEPQRLVHQMLCANLALNALGNVVAPWCGLGSKMGDALVPHVNYAVGGNFGGISLGYTGAGERVPIYSIDALEMPKAPAVIKADVEGMELDVLLGARAVIDLGRPVLYVENNGGDKSKALIAHILEQDYRAFWHVHTLFNSRNYADKADNVFGGTVSCDMLCLPRDMASRLPDDHPMKEVTGPEDEPDFRKAILLPDAVG